MGLVSLSRAFELLDFHPANRPYRPPRAPRSLAAWTSPVTSPETHPRRESPDSAPSPRSSHNDAPEPYIASLDAVAAVTTPTPAPSHLTQRLPTPHPNTIMFQLPQRMALKRQRDDEDSPAAELHYEKVCSCPLPQPPARNDA